MKKRIKQIIGVIIGIIIGISTTVGATTIFNSKDITYSSDKTTKTNVKDSLDELYNKTGKCPEGQYCYTEPLGLSDKVELGDYIKMTPTSTSYTPPGELTGCMNDANCKQNTINPSELNLWRVIKKNEDGTIEVVSEYVSSEPVFLYGKVGYMNYVGALNTVAAQYTNEKYVERTRHMGYSNQIEYCNEFSATACPRDMNHTIDVELLRDAIGSIKGYCSSKKACRYWLSGRQGIEQGAWVYDCYEEEEWAGWILGEFKDDGSVEEKVAFDSIRPILTLKADIKVKSGDGKSERTSYELE